MRYCVVILLTTSLWCSNVLAVDPLNGMQLHNVCKAYLEARMSVEGQICGYYILGFLDGAEVSSPDFCVNDVPLLDVMRALAVEIESTHLLLSHAEMPARDILLPILKDIYPCGN